MSDLHCPATLVLVCPGRQDAVRQLAETIRASRVAMVYSGPGAASLNAARACAEALGLPVRVREDLDLATGADGDAAVAEQTATVLGSVADEHRGETVVVVLPATWTASVVPERASNLRWDFGAEHTLPDATSVEISVDADGWVARSWGDERLDQVPAR